jgi:hypothetical protein
VLYLWLIILSGEDDISINSETLLMTDFVNLKIKSTQSFKNAHKGRVYVCVYRDECSYLYEYLHLYCISKKKFIPNFEEVSLE